MRSKYPRRADYKSAIRQIENLRYEGEDRWENSFPMKVFVSGATGFVGRHIVACLHAAGYSSRILVRNPESEKVQDLVSKYQVEVKEGDVTNGNTLTSGLEGTHAVIHLVGIIAESAEETFEDVHVVGTENMLAAAQLAGIERFVHMSALGTRAHAVSRYHQTKWLAEEAVRHSDLDYTIFRPSLIFGPEDQFVNRFAGIIRFSPVVPIFNFNDAHFQPVSVDTVAAAFARAVTEPRAISGVYDLCGPEALTMRQIIDEICTVMRRTRLKVRVPWWLAWKQAGMIESVVRRVSKKAPSLTQDQLIMLTENTIGNPKPANELFNLAPVKFREGIAEYLGKGKQI